jgi:hypothetical protein
LYRGKATSCNAVLITMLRIMEIISSETRSY